MIGDVNKDFDKADWIDVSQQAKYAPQNLLYVISAKWGGKNPHVTEENVRKLDESN